MKKAFMRAISFVNNESEKSRLDKRQQQLRTILFRYDQHSLVAEVRFTTVERDLSKSCSSTAVLRKIILNASFRGNGMSTL